MYDTIPKISLRALKDELIPLIWPNGAPENLLGPIEKAFEDAFMDIQTYVTCLQEWHTDVFPACATLFKCGLTVLDAPPGQIRRVRTFAKDFCDPVTLVPASFSEVNCWSRCFRDRVDAPVNAGLPALPGGFKYSETSTDSKWGRALSGIWSLDRRRIFVAPWIQSNESVVVEWDGLKVKFSDFDLVPDDQGLKRAIRLYVQKEFSRDWERDLNAKKDFTVDWMDARAEQIYRCEQSKKLPQQELCAGETASLWLHSLEDDNPASADVPTLVALIGDYGVGDVNEKSVAALVKSWSPNAIVTLGDNNYQGGGFGVPDPGISGYDQAVGVAYRSFMFPYRGSQPLLPGEMDATVNKFWPALGNHDIDHQADYLTYFAPPGNGRNYDIVIGHFHFFILNCGQNSAGTNTEPTGNDAFSVQAGWLRGRVAQSTARWKIAVVHFPPYSSFRFPGLTFLRWAYKAMGIDLVISGHNHMYERVLVDGLTYLIAGTGGAARYAFGSDVVTGSQFRDDQHFGALKMTGTCKSLLVQFVAIGGTVIDSVELT